MPSLGHSQYILWATDPDRGFCALLEEKKNKKKNSRCQIFFLVGDILKILVVFGQKKLPVWGKNLLSSHHVGGKNKMSVFFFLVGDNFISSEDSSTIEYTESGLTGSQMGGRLLLHSDVRDWSLLRPRTTGGVKKCYPDLKFIRCQSIP